MGDSHAGLSGAGLSGAKLLSAQREVICKMFLLYPLKKLLPSRLEWDLPTLPSSVPTGPSGMCTHCFRTGVDYLEITEEIRCGLP